jgi:hypothetical protein
MRRIVYALAAGTFAVILATPVFAQTQAQPAQPMAASGSGQSQAQPNSPMAASGSGQTEAQPAQPMAASGSGQTEAQPNAPMNAGGSGMAASGAGTSGKAMIESGGASDSDLNKARYDAWDQFRSSNPKIASELKRNPRLAGNAAFVDKHPELKQLFDANAGMQEDMQRNPGNYVAGAKYSAHHRHHHHHVENKG